MSAAPRHSNPQPETEAPLATQDGFTFRDLNKNGRLDPYEDSRRPLEERVENLLSQMTLEEKTGLMFHTMIMMNPDGTLVEDAGMFNLTTTSELVIHRKMNHFNILAMFEARQTAEWHNRIQKLAESTRLGIPVTISSDPRHAFTKNPAFGIASEAFSQWPEPIGLAATRDEALVREFGDIARQEYIAVGIRVALHPMADLATEPRWARINGTFGEDASLSARMVAAYIHGFQGETVGARSVACMTKHFPGAGPQKDGEDAHFSYGKEQVYPGNNFDYHLTPFEAAFKAGTAQIMPYYGQPIGLPIEEVGFGYNKDVITGLLREKYGFTGVVCTDWMLVNSMSVGGQVIMEARCWGVEHLSAEERVLKILDAGVDQLGGEECPDIIVGLVKSGRLPESRLDEPVRRILRDKFRLGLFDNPYVDVETATSVAGCQAFKKAGELAQRKSIVLLKNDPVAGAKALPLQGRPRIYVEGIDPAIASEYGQVVKDLDQADFAILRLNAPYEPRQRFLESIFHAGDLDFKGSEKSRILSILDRVPTIVDIYLERPAVIPEIAAKCAGLLADFGANDAAVLDVVFGRFSPTGMLPFELPSSMQAVRLQKEDLPYDSENPLYPFGFGLTWG
ncbi:MAG: glycoside hydrolase family 3 protein [Chloroflexota bacterium]|nr:MAG: glycoside hydrolase family 3 protein [Chloroflexota bacterium]